IPFYSVALSFSKGNKIADTFFGYVKNFGNGVEYWANDVAYRDNRKIRVSDTEDIRCNAIVYYPDRKFNFKRMRIMGSAALEICLVADGTFDCFIDYRGGKKGFLRVYDVAASIHIAKCAGAVVTDPEGKNLNNKKIDMNERFRLVVANKFLHPLLLEALK
ncbi:MAG TPA: inositol monophosphatase, partial [Archaeoglobaceae archaeon]|nr:inositol monophosphatase [Archaeoglobaceae archaeon]